MKKMSFNPLPPPFKYWQCVINLLMISRYTHLCLLTPSGGLGPPLCHTMIVGFIVFNATNSNYHKLQQFISTLDLGRLYSSYSNARVLDTGARCSLRLFAGCALPATKGLNHRVPLVGSGSKTKTVIWCGVLSSR